MGQRASVSAVHAATRFSPPRLRPEFTVRERLVDRVLSPDERLVFVSGPAGSGKSTLLAQAHARCEDAVWLSVDPADDDTATLWSALIESTARTIPGFGEQYRDRLDVAGAEAIESVISLVVNELARVTRPVRFFLDDLHFLTGERSLASLERLLHLLPAKNCLVIASRTGAPFALGRLRMERAVIEIGATDLAMDIDEARAASAAAGVALRDDALAALVERTEGWVAGLAWATMAIQDAPDDRNARSFLLGVGAVDRELTTYLVEEVLDQRSPELRAFMLETSILRRFDAALCDAVRGRPDSRELLDELDRTNSFIVSLDGRGEWFRYHHLVHEVLSAVLEREAPAAVQSLHRRASRWLSDHGEVVESIYHARAASDDREAADILCAHWWDMMNGGRIETAYALFEEFGSAEICAYQPLAISAALLYSLAGDHQRAQVFFRAAERGHHEGPPPDGSATMESSLAIMRGAVAFDGVNEMLAAGRRACELEPVDSPWRPLAEFLVALGHVWRGELDEAEPMLDDVVAQARANEALVVDALAQRAWIRLARNDIEAAWEAAESACSLATATGLDTVFVTAIAHGTAALARLAAGDVHGAEHHLDAAQHPMAGVNAALPIDAMQTRLVLADAAIQLGRSEEARGYLEAATRTSHRYPDTGILGTQLTALNERLDDEAEQAPVELSEREQAVLELMPSELSIREIAETLYVSKETVTTHRRNVYRKLSVTTRADAVVAGRRAGLLPECRGHRLPSDETT